MDIFNSDADRMRWKLLCAVRTKVDELGQVEAAKIAGTSQPTISSALNHTQKPMLDTLIRWVKRLGFEVEIVTA